MIDIHNHILYDCDDGAECITDSIEMLREAYNVGVTDIILTPHYMEDGYKNEKNILISKKDILQEKLNEENIKINLYNGEEVFIFLDIDKYLLNKEILSLNNSRYVLIELPLVEEVNYLNDVIYKLLSINKVPILAHPERYMRSAKSIDYLKDLIMNGVLLQLNVNSLIGRYGKKEQKVAIDLLKQGMVHFVASDAHSKAGYFAFRDSMGKLRRLVDEDTFNRITYLNPKAILDDEEITNDFIYDKHRKRLFGVF